MYANVYDTRQAQMSRGTPGDFRHGPDLPLTRKTIRWFQEQRRKEQKAPLSLVNIVRLCVSIPEERHLNRAINLSGKGRKNAG